MVNKVEEISDKKISKLKGLSTSSAGRIMTKAIPIVSIDVNIGFVEKLLINEIKNFENINYVYVTNSSGYLKGVLSIKEIFRVPKDVPVIDVMNSSLVTVRPSTDRERVALLAVENNIKNIPVVDKNGTLLGVVPSDIILDVLHQEGIEDVLRSAGILRHDSARDFINAKISVHFRKRLPWLIFGLFGGFGAAFVVSFFESILSEMIILTAFIPSVVYMADAVGSQTQTIFIRNMSLNEKIKLSFYLKKEFIISIFLSFFLSILASLLTLWWWKDPLIASIIAFSFFATIMASALSGIILPWIFFKMKFDPAISSGPFSTVLRDILSILIYFIVAFIMLSF